MEYANAFPFHQLCFSFEEMKTQKTTNGRLDSLWKTFMKNFITKQGQHDSGYPVYRLILPSLDGRDRYQLKELNLGKMLIKIFGIPEKDAHLLKKQNWNDPTIMNLVAPHAHGNFSNTVQFVLQGRTGVSKSTMTVGEVNVILDELRSGTLEEGKREKLLKELCWNLTPMECKWIVRIILRDMKV